VTVRFAKAGHGLTTDDVVAARDWLETVGEADSFPHKHETRE